MCSSATFSDVAVVCDGHVVIGSCAIITVVHISQCHSAADTILSQSINVEVQFTFTKTERKLVYGKCIACQLATCE